MQNNYNNNNDTFTSGYHYVDNPQNNKDSLDDFYSGSTNTVSVLTDSMNSDDYNTNSESAQTSSLSKEQYAGFGVRLFAYFIDNLILFIGLLIVRIILLIATHIGGLYFLSNDVLFQYSICDILLYIIRIAYFVLMTYYTGATLGKHLLKIHVVSVNQSEKYSFIDILYRETVGRFLSKIILYIGYLFSIANRDKAALHDMLSDTRVTYKRHN